MYSKTILKPVSKCRPSIRNTLKKRLYPLAFRVVETQKYHPLPVSRAVQVMNLIVDNTSISAMSERMENSHCGPSQAFI